MTRDDGRNASGDPSEIDAYLFNRLAATEREALEDRFFADEVFASQMLDRELDLVDALAAGELPDDDARALAARLEATATGRDRLRVARALRTRQRADAGELVGRRLVSPGVRPRSPAWWQVVGWTGLAAGAAWLAVDDVRLRQRLAQLNARPTPAAVRVDRDPPAPPGPVRAELSAIRTRGRDQVTVVAVPSGAEAVHLVLPGAGGAGRFDARVETSPGGELVAHQRNLVPTAGAIDVWLSTVQVPDGDYEVLLLPAGSSGAGLLGQYAFRVQRGAVSSP